MPATDQPRPCQGHSPGMPELRSRPRLTLAERMQDAGLSAGLDAHLLGPLALPMHTSMPLPAARLHGLTHLVPATLTPDGDSTTSGTGLVLGLADFSMPCSRDFVVWSPGTLWEGCTNHQPRGCVTCAAQHADHQC